MKKVLIRLCKADGMWYKRFLSILITVIIFVGVMPLVSLPVSATTMDINTFSTKLETFKTTIYNNGDKYKDNSPDTYGKECFGYANYLANFIFGSFPCTDMSGVGVRTGWTITHGENAVNNLCCGDIVRYLYHSIFITGISGDTIYFTDANSDYKNTVIWNKTISKSDLKDRVRENLTSGVSSIDGRQYTGWVAHFNNGVVQDSTSAPIVTKITASAKYAKVGDSVTFNFPATYASKYELAIENTTTGERIQYTMLDTSSFTQKFWSEGLHKISVNAYGTKIVGFDDFYFEVHSGNRPNTYVGGKMEGCYFTPQELTISHDAVMQKQIVEATLNYYKDGKLWYTGSIIDTGIYTTYFYPGVYEGNILLTYESGYSVYTKTLRWYVGEKPNSAAITASSTAPKVGDLVTFTLNATDGKEHSICIGDGNMEIYNANTNSCTYKFDNVGTYYIYGWCRNEFGTTYPEPLTIIVGEVPRVSSITYNKSTIRAGDNVTFTLNAENAKQYAFCIGDGTNILVDTESVSGKFSDNKFTYQFTEAGTYYVWGIAYNDYGATHIGGIEVVVNEILPQISSFDYRIIDSHILIELSVCNMTDKTNLYFAAYDGQGRMTEIKIPTIINGKAEMILPLSGVDKIKAFIWNSDFSPVTYAERLITENLD